MELKDDVYIVAAEYDSKSKREQDDGISKPIIVEISLDASSKRHAKALALRLTNSGYGDAKVGRVSFLDIDQVNPVKACGNLLLPQDEALDTLINDLGTIFLDENVRPSLPVMSEATRAHLRLTVLKWVRGL